MDSHCEGREAVNRLQIRLLGPFEAWREDELLPPDAVILKEPPGCRFDPTDRCEIDLDAFTSHAQQGHEAQRHADWAEATHVYRAADALYRGDHLPEEP